MAKRQVKTRPARVRRRGMDRRRRRGRQSSVPEHRTSTMAEALTTLTGALSLVASAAESATLALEGARVDAAMQAEERLIRSLASDRLLNDLVGLRAALSAGGGADPVSMHRNFAVALEAWLAEHFHLEPFLEAGSEREVPASQLSNYELLGQTPAVPGALLRLKVLAAGWKWRGRVVVKPEVIIAPAPGSGFG